MFEISYEVGVLGWQSHFTTVPLKFTTEEDAEVYIEKLGFRENKDLANIKIKEIE